MWSVKLERSHTVINSIVKWKIPTSSYMYEYEYGYEYGKTLKSILSSGHVGFNTFSVKKNGWKKYEKGKEAGQKEEE